MMIRRFLSQAGGGTSPFGDGLAPTAADSPLAVGAATNTGATASLENIISTLIGSLTVVAGLFFVFYFILAGVNWVTAGGDSSKVQKARDQMVQGVLGLVVVVAAYSIIGIIGSIIGIDLINPGQVLQKIAP